jgi:hypothetical protein
MTNPPAPIVKTVEALKQSLVQLASTYLPEGHLFLSSASKPGLKARPLPSSLPLPVAIRSVSAKLAAETFGAVEPWASWLERIRELYPVKEFDERDPKE